LCKSCMACFKFYSMFYFTCDRSFTLAAGVVQVIAVKLVSRQRTESTTTRQSAAVSGGGGGGGGRHGLHLRRQSSIVRTPATTDILPALHQGVADEDRTAHPRRAAGQGAGEAAAGAGRPRCRCSWTSRRPTAQPAAGSRQDATVTHGRVSA